MTPHALRPVRRRRLPLSPLRSRLSCRRQADIGQIKVAKGQVSSSATASTCRARSACALSRPT